MSTFFQVTALVAQKDGENKEKKGRRVANRIAEFKEARSRRKTVERSRELAAEQQNQAVQSGVGAGSAYAGAAGSLQSQTSGALSFNQSQVDGQNAVNSWQNSANKRYSWGETFSTAASVYNSGMKAYTNGG